MISLKPQGIRATGVRRFRAAWLWASATAALAVCLSGCGDTPEPAAPADTGVASTPVELPADPARREAELTRRFTGLDRQISADLAASAQDNVVDHLTHLLNEYRIQIALGQGTQASAAAVPRCSGFDRALQRLTDEQTMLDDAAPLLEAREWKKARQLWRMHPLFANYRLDDLPRLKRMIVWTEDEEKRAPGNAR